MLRRLAKRQFVRNVAILSSGQAIAQGLAIAASPILTRLYTPDAFGLFGLLIAFSAILAVVSGLRYELAIVTARDDQSAANLLALSCGIVLLVTALSVGLVGFGGSWMAGLVNRPGFGELLWWLPVLVLAGGMFQVLSYWTTRRKNFKQFAVSKVVRSVASLVTQISAGLATIGPIGLIGGRALGAFLAGGILAAQIWRDDRSSVMSSMKFSHLVKAAKENTRFPKYNAPQNLINSVSQASVPYTLAAIFGVEIVGLYYLAERVMKTPSVLVAGSVRRVFYQRASEIHNKGKSFRKLLMSTIAGLILIGITPLVLLLLFGPELFSLVFGEDWRKAGILAQWLASWWFFSFVSAPAVETFIILKLQKYLLYYQISISVARIVAILMGAMIGDDIAAIAACSLVGMVFNLALMISALIIVRQTSNQSS